MRKYLYSQIFFKRMYLEGFPEHGLQRGPVLKSFFREFFLKTIIYYVKALASQ